MVVCVCVRVCVRSATPRAREKFSSAYLFPQTQEGRAQNNGRHLRVLPERVGGPAQDQLSHHDGGHFARLGQGGHRKGESAAEGQCRERLADDLRATSNGKLPQGQVGDAPGQAAADQAHENVGRRLHALQEPDKGELGAVVRLE